MLRLQILNALNATKKYQKKQRTFTLKCNQENMIYAPKILRLTQIHEISIEKMH